MRQLISFSLYRSQRREHTTYLRGMLRNLRLQESLYPEWTCRVYLSADMTDARTALAAEGAEVIEMPKSRGASGTLWRYRAAFETDLAALLFRDADCRFSARERQLVDFWLDSPYRYHVIRDGPEPHAKLGGGLWGMRNPSADVLTMLGQLIHLGDDRYVSHGVCDAFLQSRLYPLIQGDILEHDSSLDPSAFLFETDGYYVGKSLD